MDEGKLDYSRAKRILQDRINDVRRCVESEDFDEALRYIHDVQTTVGCLMRCKDAENFD